MSEAGYQVWEFVLVHMSTHVCMCLSLFLYVCVGGGVHLPDSKHLSQVMCFEYKMSPTGSYV